MADPTYVIAALIVLAVKALIVIGCCYRRSQGSSSHRPDPRFRTLKMDKFLTDMEREKPIRFTPQQLRLATDNYSHLLGTGGFGAVYKGAFPNGVLAAVKVLRGASDKRIEQQFMAEVSTIGRTHHFNLVRLFGFCYERDLAALVYEYMAKGSLDKLLFQESKSIEWEKLYEIAIGTAKGIVYLHEECQQRIIHYDIKPGNVLLDARLHPKVADFGLAKLCNRDNTHLTLTGGRGTPGYAAPELWMPFPVNHKCDVYSFGMLLFEVLGRRRNLEANLSDSQEWFPMWVWKQYEKGEISHAMEVFGIEEKDREKAERVALVALWCVQYRPEPRPWMSVVLRMLEGGVEIPAPPNPFQYLAVGTPCPAAFDWQTWSGSTDPGSIYSHVLPGELSSPVMRKYEIEMASS